MTELDRNNHVVSETAVLAAVILPDAPPNEEPLCELRGLAETAGATVVGGLTQRRESPNVKTYLGKGKIEELSGMVAGFDADVVLFDNDLSPGQKRNIEKHLDVKVLDRTELILDIFASRAQTPQSRLAVELAQLQYSLPRLKHMWSHLDREKGGIGMRGPGEKQLESDRRLIEKRIRNLGRELDVIGHRKQRQVASRRDRLTISLVGYTNAGKSTLLNTLTGAEVLAEDKLFATLDTRTRRWQLPGWGPVLLSDTVGFIRDLPHQLVASFKATLEEARQADLLLHVADASSPAVLEQIGAVYKVLEELGIEEKDTLLILNKIDALPNPSRLNRLLSRYPNAVPISARSGESLDQLAAGVSDALSQDFLDLDIEMGVENGQLLAFLSACGEVLSRRYHENKVIVHCRIPQKDLGMIRKADATVGPHVSVGPVAGDPPESQSTDGGATDGGATDGGATDGEAVDSGSVEDVA